MKKVKRILVCIIMCILVLSSEFETGMEVLAAQSEVYKEYHKSNFFGASIERNKHEAVEKLSTAISDLDILFYEDGNVHVDIRIEEEKLDFDLVLYRGKIAYGVDNESIIGIAADDFGDYDIVSFRIEKYADSITLMKPNLDLKGKTVLYLAVGDKKSNKIIYIQECLEDIKFDDIMDRIPDVQMYCDSEEILNKEYEYMFGTTNATCENSISNEMVCRGEVVNDRSISGVLSEEDQNIIEKLSEQPHIYGQYYSTNAEDTPLFVDVDNSIFKSITSYNTWTHVNGENQVYSYWQYGYMGTDNPATIIIGLAWIHDYNVTDGVRHSMSISFNETVLYNLTTHELGCSWLEKNPATVTDMKIVTSLKQSSSKNCFISLQQGETSKGTSYSLTSIATLALKKLGFDEIVQAWNTWNTIKGKAVSSTAEKISFYGTPELQDKYYDAVITECTVEAKYDLRNVGDTLNMYLTPYAYPNCSYSFEYTVDQ